MDLEGDAGRIRRQQQVMRALAKAIMQAPTYKIPGLVQEVRRQFETTLDNEAVGSAAFFAKNIGDSSKVQPLTLFGEYYRKGSVRLNKPMNEALLKTVFGPTFNPDNFLQRSPYTESGDEIGSSNNSSQEARAVLREAGLLEKGDIPRAAELDVPVRVEPSKNEDRQATNQDDSSGATLRSRRSGRTQIADSSSERSSYAAVADSSESERPRRRRVRRRRDDGSQQATTRVVTERRERTITTSDDAASGSGSSPVPVAEDASGSSESSSGSSGDSQSSNSPDESQSPLPQPE
jgi:hypothetical protein